MVKYVHANGPHIPHHHTQRHMVNATASLDDDLTCNVIATIAYVLQHLVQMSQTAEAHLPIKVGVPEKGPSV